jgi:methylenetetrahydrofolate reductase (NADPH)
LLRIGWIEGSDHVHIRELYREGHFGLSFEIFPPKTPDGDEALDKTLERLAVYRPAFISCTYGAGGSTRNRTLDWCAKIQERFHLTATAHFTCVGSTREQLVDWLNLAHGRGIRNIMALRGDPPQGQESFQAVAGGFRYANELVTLIRETLPHVGIGVAGYPEKHLECIDAETDLRNLKRKVDAGANAVFTQLFYENEHFFDFRDRYERAGIRIPLIPGIMPITEFARIQRITSMCGASIPEPLAARLEAVQDDKEAQFEIGVEHAVRQCRGLIDTGAPGIHFYVLNRSSACERILDGLGMKPAQVECA